MTKRIVLKVYPALASEAGEAQERERERLSNEELRFHRIERDILGVLNALHVNLGAPEAGFPVWDEQVIEFVRAELLGDEDAVEEVRRRTEWHRKRAAELRSAD